MDVVDDEEIENLVLDFKIREKLRRFLKDYREGKEPMDILIHRYAQEIVEYLI